MHIHRKWEFITVLIIIFTTLNLSDAKDSKPISEKFNLDPFYDAIYRWGTHRIQSEEKRLKFAAPTVVAGLLSFIAAIVSSAGGIGGGGLFLPILTIVAGVDLKTASSFSAFMVTGGSIANVICSVITPSAKYGGKTLVDYDIALLSQPFMLLGVSIGVICNLIFPEWLITILFAVFLAWSTFKTCKSGILYWNLESEESRSNGFQKLEKGMETRDQMNDTGNQSAISSAEVGLLSGKPKCKVDIPWIKMGVLMMIWFSFFILYLLRGNRYGKGIIVIKACGVAYWFISSIQVPLAIIFTSWILCKGEQSKNQSLNDQETEVQTKNAQPQKLIVFPVMALLAGLLGGVFGIGGGMLISPLLLHVGIAPEVTAATCSFMVFFSSTMSAFQYLLLGMEHVQVALIFAVICFVGSVIGLIAVRKVIQKHGRASIIVFSVGIVLAVSTVLITSFGAVDVWEDYISGRYMGFKRPC